MRAWRGGLVALGLTLAATLRAHAAGPQHDPACFTVSFVPASGVAVTRMPRGFLRAGRDSVWTRSGVWRRDLDYVLDRLHGDLRLLRTPVPGETVWVRACGLVAPPPLEYQPLVYQPVRTVPVGDTTHATPSPAPFARPATARDPSQAPFGGALEVTGNKTLAVDFGSSQDAALRQSLDLSLSGRIAPGVELTGVLTDRDTPLSASGATQDLQSIDRVLLELRARDARASFGDVPLSVTGGEFARLERRVQGVAGEWRPGAFELRAAAAGSQGEYMRLAFAGVDGRQGPYLLTDRDGAPGVTVVAGSEQVTVDGVRMTRGEGADYAIDYERARLTFSNRRPISSASRIVVEYQYALTRFRRGVTTASTGWQRGAWALHAEAISERDDGGRPITGTLDAADRALLASAGDSLALAPGVTAGGGDYDSVRVAGTLAYAFAGLDSGAFAVRFARVGAGLGDYADSAVVGGRTVYRFVGAGAGAWRVGRALPAPEAHRLVAFGARTRLGGFAFESEGAVSSLDRNTFSARDGGDDAGGALRLRVEGETRAGALPGRVGVSAAWRSVDRRFAPFSRLERAFIEEDWGLRPGADLEHPQRGELAGWWRSGEGRELRAGLARLRTPDGYDGVRREANARYGRGAWRVGGTWLDAAGRTTGARFGDGGRERATGDLQWTSGWLVPRLRVERDRRTTPGDTSSVLDRVEAFDADVASGARATWRMALGGGTRRDRRDAGRTSLDSRTQALRAELETPAARPWGAVLALQRRDTRDRTSGVLVRQDLASSRVRAESRATGLAGTVQVERTGEAENRRVRQLTFVGAGRGGYDATGNFVGTGDHDLVLVVSPDLERFARTAVSARASWAFGRSDAWRGTRFELTFEDEARRRGVGRWADVFLSGGTALGDAGLARASVLHRFESEIAPGSRAAAFRVRVERRVSVDRSFTNYAQSTDQRTGALRWRSRPGTTTSAEAEARVTWQRAGQAVTGGASYARTLVDQGGTAQFVWQPGAGLRTAGVLEATWSRAPGTGDVARTVRVGPDVSASVGRAGRADLIVRRAFVNGSPLGLLPTADPIGAARWDATARFDWRVHTTTTIGFDTQLRERPGHRTVVTGRAEVRAFF